MLLLILKMPAADDITDATDVEASYVWDTETVTTPTYVREEDNAG
jgi:hypothetical protein